MINPGKWSTTFAVVGVIGALAMAGPAAAERPEGHGSGHHGKMMAKMDTDGDGRISRAESAAFHTERFNRMDSNGDDFIDAEERKAQHEKMKNKFKEAFEKRQQKGKGNE